MLRSNSAHAATSNGWYDKTKNILGSRLFFSAVIALFVLQAGYIAIKSGFPLAFDENFHLGIIQLHATQLNPFFGQLADSTGQYGALATDPSYLYHYLMSFPYRVLEQFTQNPYFTVLALRFINIGLFVTGLLLFKKVLGYTGASKALINLTLLGFTVLPLESFTAAQINYDNLLFPATGAALLFCLQFVEHLRKSNSFDLKSLTLMLSACLLGSQVKYAFLPIFAAITGFTTYMIVRWAMQNKKLAPKIISNNFKSLSTGLKIGLLGILLLSSGLFGWRYGYNVTQYGSPLPDCSKVLSVEACMQNGPWARNHQLEQGSVAAASFGQAKQFVKWWTYISVSQLFSVLDANQGGSTVSPIRQLIVGGLIVLAGGAVLLVSQWRKLRQISYPIALMMTVCGVYLGSLIMQNYGDFTRYGMPVAIQGRYLLPVLLLLMVLLAHAYSTALNKTPQLKMAALAFAVFIGMQGGGAITYALRANDSWSWSNTAAVLSIFPDSQDNLSNATAAGTTVSSKP